MSEDTTRKLPSDQSFEERIFARFDSIDGQFESIHKRFEAVDERFESMDRRFEAIENRLSAAEQWMKSTAEWMQSVDRRLDSLEAHALSTNLRLQRLEEESERRALETKPIWEQVLVRLDELREGQIELQGRFRAIERGFEVLTADNVKLRADQSYLERRLDKLESKIA